MKFNLFFFLLLFSFKLFAQERVIPVNVGLYGAYVIQPGIKVGTEFNLKEWTIKKANKSKLRTLLVSPQIGVFFRLDNHTSFLLNGDFGYRMGNDKRSFYMIPSIGLGYLMSNQILSQTVDLSNGSISDDDREIRSYFLPTINYEFGGKINTKLGWYSKLSYGRKIAAKIEDAAFFALELGMSFVIRKERK